MEGSGGAGGRRSRGSSPEQKKKIGVESWKTGGGRGPAYVGRVSLVLLAVGGRCRCSRKSSRGTSGTPRGVRPRART